MSTSIFTNIILKSLVIIVGVSTIHSINKNLFHVNAADAKSDYGTWDFDWDYRQSTSLSSGSDSEDDTPRAKRNIFLIRHGNYDKISKMLNETGKCQAKITAVRLADLGHKYKICLITSPMPRAMQTAKYIIKNIPRLKLVCDDNIREGVPILPEPVDDIRIGKEKIQRDGERLEFTFEVIFYRACYNQIKDSYEIVVCHGNVIRYFICRALQLPPEAWMRFNINHGSITWIVIHPDGRVELKSAGDSAYMPTKLLTSY